MSGGLTTFMVVEPVFPWELRSLLLHAAVTGQKASFKATSLDDPELPPVPHTFTVKVTSAQFEAPAAFDVTDQDGHIIQIKLSELGPVEFTVYV